MRTGEHDPRARIFTRLIVAVGLSSWVYVELPPTRPNVSLDARELHADALVWDMTLPIITPGRAERKRDILSRFVRGGFDVVSMTLAIDIVGTEVALQSFANEREFIETNPAPCVLVRSADDIRAAKRDKKLAVGVHFQGTGPFEDDLSSVSRFYALGVRHALITYNQRNRAGCGCQTPEDTGLTLFGQAIIREMNRVGMIVDCAHTGFRTSMEAIEASEAPVIASHANIRALCEHPRCITDELIRAIAAHGGVIGITGIGEFLGGGGATPARLANHIDYVANLVGPQHVGLGLDHVYDMETFSEFVRANPAMYPAESQRFDASQLSPEDGPVITDELLRRGYRVREVRGILGENWLRVCEAIWK